MTNKTFSPLILCKKPTLSKLDIVARKLGNILVVVLMVVSMQACVTKKVLEEQASIELNNNLAGLQKWKLKGKIAWITPKERKSAYINWKQDGQQMEFKLTNVLGINLATLKYDDLYASLEVDGETYTDSSPSTLIYQTTGWDVPIIPLSSWIKGAASIDGREYGTINSTSNKNKLAVKQRITRYENGLIKQLIPQCKNCDAWLIDYKNYENTTINNVEYQLPTDISLTNVRTQAVIKIRVNEWSQ